MKTISLTGKSALKEGVKVLVDDEDYEELNKYKWFGNKTKSGFYAIRRQAISKTRKGITLSMHRIILKVNDNKIQVDHIDGDSTNNQKCNLRLATHGQNQANRTKRKAATSKYLGVVYVPCKPSQGIWKKKNPKVWRASCKSDGKLYVKYASSETEAAIEYNKLAIKHHKEFARLNIIDYDIV